MTTVLLDEAVSAGVVLVASARNSGPAGAMGYPGAYPNVMSVAPLGDVHEWRTGWQDLVVAAPGSWIVGPYQEQQGRPGYFFVGGTSQAAPHISGIAALMLQKNGGLGAAQVEQILESVAIQIPDIDQRVIPFPGLDPAVPPSWDANRSGAALVTADAALAATP